MEQKDKSRLDKYYVDRHNGKWAVLERHFLFHWVKYTHESYHKCVEYAEKLNYETKR